MAVCLFGDCFLKDQFSNDLHFRVLFYTRPGLARLPFVNSEYDLLDNECARKTISIWKVVHVDSFWNKGRSNWQMNYFQNIANGRKELKHGNAREMNSEHDTKPEMHRVIYDETCGGPTAEAWQCGRVFLGQRESWWINAEGNAWKTRRRLCEGTDRDGRENESEHMRIRTEATWM